MLRHCMKDRGRVIGQVDRNQENSKDLGKTRVSRIMVINQGSEHRNLKRPTPKPKQGIKRTILSSVSSRNHKYRRPNNSSQESQPIAGPSHQQDSRQDKSPTVASRHEGSGQYNKARDTKTTKDGTNTAAERTVRSKQTTAVRLTCTAQAKGHDTRQSTEIGLTSLKFKMDGGEELLLVNEKNL
ncbi:uncharacterized protein TNCV_1608041 [Trichonephila clavipes]|nr:uncharacterized protein TNCV_1608041 [Trichonephila clavipes]